MQREFVGGEIGEKYDTGDEDTPSSSSSAGYVRKPSKRSTLACVRCRRKHVKCPGGDPCSKCATAGIACEYLEPNKKLTVSMKYLQQLQENLADLKRENVKLQSIVNTKNSEVMENNMNEGVRANGTVTPVEVNSQKEAALDDDDGDDDDDANDIGKDDEAGIDPVFSNGEVELVSNFAQRSGRLVESRTGQRYFVGSSSMTLFGLEIQSLLSKYLSDRDENGERNSVPNGDTYGGENVLLQGPGDDTDRIDVLQEEGNAYKIVLNKNEGNDDISVNFTLPSYSYAVFLVDTFITYNDGCFYFFNEGMVKHGLKIAYDGGTFYDDRTLQTIWFCKVLLIFAIGEMYLGTSNNVNGNKIKDNAKLPGSGFFEEASQIFSCLFSSGRIESVTKEGGIEVMLLYAFYLQVADCTVASYFYFGQALRACLILGMHVDAQRETLTRFELEHRRRLWWTVYMFERMLSSKAGLPLSFTDNTISTELPGDFDMSKPPPGCEHYIFPEAEYIINCVKIVRINAQILNKLYQHQPNTNILAALKSAVKQLLQWRNNLPDFLQVDFTEKHLNISRLGANLFTEYFQGLNLAIRPLLFHFASIQLKKFRGSNTYINLQNYSSTISALLNCSLQASVNTIRSLWALMDQNMVALFGYMDREYLFTASCTLVLFNAAFGIHEQTYEHLDHALNIFTKMRNLGNNPAGLRRSQLLTLVANFDFHGIMKDMISAHNDTLKPDTQYDSHNFRNVNIVSQTMTDSASLSDIINATLARSSQINLTQQESQIMEKNSNQFDPLNAADDVELHALLDKMTKVSQTDDELWKEISDQAMWLGSAMEPAVVPGNEMNYIHGKSSNY